jgi:hypothetical protein
MLSLAAGFVTTLAGAGLLATSWDRHDGFDRPSGRRAKNVILFIGDGAMAWAYRR